MAAVGKERSLLSSTPLPSEQPKKEYLMNVKLDHPQLQQQQQSPPPSTFNTPDLLQLQHRAGPDEPYQQSNKVYTVEYTIRQCRGLSNQFMLVIIFNQRCLLAPHGSGIDLGQVEWFVDTVDDSSNNDGDFFYTSDSEAATTSASPSSPYATSTVDIGSVKLSDGTYLQLNTCYYQNLEYDANSQMFIIQTALGKHRVEYSRVEKWFQEHFPKVFGPNAKSSAASSSKTSRICYSPGCQVM